MATVSERDDGDWAGEDVVVVSLMFLCWGCACIRVGHFGKLSSTEGLSKKSNRVVMCCDV
jgi:hypothetical protein